MVCLVNEEGDYSRLARMLDCFCIGALFHAPELFSEMNDYSYHNSDVAVDFLFRKGRFVEGHDARGYGTVNILCEKRHESDWFAHPEHVTHVSVNLGGLLVLTKHGTGISSCEIMSYDDDMGAYTWAGGPHFESFMVTVA